VAVTDLHVVGSDDVPVPVAIGAVPVTVRTRIPLLSQGLNIRQEV
jgi:hypothetical protein